MPAPLCVDDAPAGYQDTGCGADAPICTAGGTSCVECSEDADCEAGTCDAVSSQCQAAGACGNGTLDGTEGCDDGDAHDGDGCSAACQVEHGFACSGQPSACTSACGDGLLASDEGCDDGNATAQDGCSEACAAEAGWICSMSDHSLCCLDVDSDGVCDLCPEQVAGDDVPGFSGGAGGCAVADGVQGSGPGLLVLLLGGILLRRSGGAR